MSDIRETEELFSQLYIDRVEEEMNPAEANAEFRTRAGNEANEGNRNRLRQILQRARSADTDEKIINSRLERADGFNHVNKRAGNHNPTSSPTVFPMTTLFPKKDATPANFFNQKIKAICPAHPRKRKINIHQQQINAVITGYCPYNMPWTSLNHQKAKTAAADPKQEIPQEHPGGTQMNTGTQPIDAIITGYTQNNSPWTSWHLVKDETSELLPNQKEIPVKQEKSQSPFVASNL